MSRSAARAAQIVGLVEPVERVERLRHAPRCARQEDPFAQRLVQPETFRCEPQGGGGIAGPELDPDGLEGDDVREQDLAAPLRQLRTRASEDLARLVQATEHRQGRGSIGTEEVIPPLGWLVLVEPREQFRYGSRPEGPKCGAPA